LPRLKSVILLNKVILPNNRTAILLNKDSLHKDSLRKVILLSKEASFSKLQSYKLHTPELSLTCTDILFLFKEK
jgi:hypothetical protein